MTTFKRIVIVALSVGWIAPLCVAFAIGRAFSWLAYGITVGTEQPVPWHTFEWMDELFYFSMAWLALVVGGWTLHLTRRS